MKSLLLKVVLKWVFKRLVALCRTQVDTGDQVFNNFLQPYLEDYQVKALFEAFYTILYVSDAWLTESFDSAPLAAAYMDNLKEIRELSDRSLEKGGV